MNGLALAAALALAQAPATPEPDAAAPPAAQTSTPTATSTAPPTSTATPTAIPTATPTRSRKPFVRTEPVEGPSASSPAPTPASAGQARDGADAERAAREFLEALARGDAAALARAASERFSFDGDVLAGRETIRRNWRDLLAARPPAAQPSVGAIEILQATDAATRFGKPPARLAGLLRHGVTVAIGDVGGRTVVLFVAREGGRMAVLGMHD